MADPQSVAAHQAAIDRLNSASGGGVVYVLAAEVPSAGIVFSATIEATASSCEGRVLAFFSGRTLGGEIVDGRIVYCSESAAPACTAPAHELGHSFGLAHSRESGDLHVPDPRRSTPGFHVPGSPHHDAAHAAPRRQPVPGQRPRPRRRSSTGHTSSSATKRAGGGRERPGAPRESRSLLTREQAHVGASRAFAGLRPEHRAARLREGTHSVREMLEHLRA